jgi:hypothetical protein
MAVTNRHVCNTASGFPATKCSLCVPQACSSRLWFHGALVLTVNTFHNNKCTSMRHTWRGSTLSFGVHQQYIPSDASFLLPFLHTCNAVRAVVRLPGHPPWPAVHFYALQQQHVLIFPSLFLLYTCLQYVL